MTGTATIAPGAVLKIIPAGQLAVGQSYTVLTATGGVTGQFTFDSALASSFLGLTDIYTADSVRIQFAQVRSFASAALTPNQMTTAGGLDSITGASPLLSALLVLPDDIGARAAFDLLSGEIHPAMHTALVEDSRIPRGAVLERLADDEAAAGGWIEAVGNWGASDGERGVTASLDRDTIGIVGGVDVPIGENARVGLAGAYTSTDVRLPERLSSGEADSYHILAYLGLRASAFGLHAGVGYSSTDLSTERSVAFAGFSESLAADYNGETLQAFGEIGYQLPLGDGTVEPIAALSYVRVRTDGFSEAGGAAALAAEKESQETANSVAGVRFATAPQGPFRIEGLLGWRHAFDGRAPSRRLSFAGGAPFEIGAAGLSKDAALLDMEASLAVASGVSLGIAYHGVLGDRSHDHMVRGALRIAF